MSKVEKTFMGFFRIGLNEFDTDFLLAAHFRCKKYQLPVDHGAVVPKLDRRCGGPICDGKGVIARGVWEELVSYSVGKAMVFKLAIILFQRFDSLVKSGDVTRCGLQVLGIGRVEVKYKRRRQGLRHWPHIPGSAGERYG